MQDLSQAVTKQPPPLGEGEAVLELVLKDFRKIGGSETGVRVLRGRAEFGKKKYGTVLRLNNGRDALVDALQEADDLCMYLGQKYYELVEMSEAPGAPDSLRRAVKAAYDAALVCFSMVCDIVAEKE